MKIEEVNTGTREGKLLLMAVAALTVSPEICLNGKKRKGIKMTPDEVLSEIEKVAQGIYEDYIPIPSVKP